MIIIDELLYYFFELISFSLHCLQWLDSANKDFSSMVSENCVVVVVGLVFSNYSGDINP